jgi:hypothetical protein
VGRALIDRVRAWAAETGRSTITLTTFAEVPWNGPLFAHLGFIVIQITKSVLSYAPFETRKPLAASIQR